MSTATPIRLGVIGAGIFARDTHIPVIKALGDAFEIVAIFSRTEASAAALNSELSHEADLYMDVEALLRRDDIDAVDVVLPIPAMPDIIEMALKAGKHVFSEKPLAATLAIGQRLLNTYAAYPDLIWMVAENWRYENAFVQAAEVIKRGDIGKPILSYCTFHVAIRPDTNKYYQTPWRRNGELPGGFLIDGGVHHIAALRLVLGEIVQVSATLRLVKPDLPPADTISAALRFESGLIGTYAATWVTKAPWEQGLTVIGEQGALRVDRPFLEISKGGQTKREIVQGAGVEAELTAFARAIRYGDAHRNTAAEAFRDLAVAEALIESAHSKKWVAPKQA